jgi:excinuclease ABC subunit C
MVAQRQKIVSTAMKDEDVVAFARSNGEACVQVFFIRGGKLIGQEHFVLENTGDEEAREIMTQFVTQFYDNATYVPPRILLQHEIDEAAVIQSWLGTKRGEKVSIRVPRKGEKKQLVNMVAENAAEVLEQMRIRWLADAGKTGLALQELAERLTLASPPQRIECYDISNIQGTSAVGSMVVFEGGQPKNGAYRRFKIKGGEHPNDYAMLQEVLRRRFKRATRTDNKDESWGILPDLLIVDGGKGQLSSALEVMRELEVVSVPVAALAKEREEIFLPETPEPIMLPRTSQSLYLVQRIRDEAHRFALAYHQRLREQRAFKSLLDDVPGIGPRRKAALIHAFGSVKHIREASVEELAAVEGMTARLAETIKQHL